MPEISKPSNTEDEYFAREDIEKMHKLALKRAAELAEKERQELRKLHHGHCPNCGMDLHALKRANIETPSKGAHLLRHTAATEMLRNGVPLDRAGLVLRHRSIDMTAYYAKADVALLKQIAQPWPEVNR